MRRRRPHPTGLLLAAALVLLPGTVPALEPPPETGAPEASGDAPPTEARGAPFAPTRYVLERVEVLGNRRTRDTLILRNVTLAPGGVVDEDEVRRTRRRLLATGLFRQVEVRLARGSSPGLVLLVIQVEERSPLVISDLTGGYTEVSPVFGGFGLADGNLFGRGLLGTGAFAVGTDGRWAGRLSLHDPAFLGSDLMAGVAATWIRGVEVDCPEGLGRCAIAELDRLRYERIGGILSFGLRSGPNSRVFLHYRGEALHAEAEAGTRRQRDPDLPPADLPFIGEGRTGVSSVAVAWESDTRNDPFLANRGTFVSVSAELSSQLFFSSYDFSRYRLSLSHHLPAWRDHSVAFGVFGGLVQGDAPFFDRFVVADHAHFTVGANTVPRALELSFMEVSQYDDVLVSGHVTYQVPLFDGGDFVFRAHAYLSAALTLSARSADRSLFDLSTDPRNEVSRFPLSGDVGIRLDTAVGVFSLGLAYPLDLVL